MNTLAHISNDVANQLSLLLSPAAGRNIAAGAAHAVIIKLQESIGSSFSLWNKLLHYHSQYTSLKLAHRLFDTMPQRDSVSYNTLITAYIRRNRDANTALTLYSGLLAENLKPNSITLCTLLSGVASVNMLELLHCHSVKLGLNRNPFVGSSAVKLYEKVRNLAHAKRAFDDIDEVDSVSWNVMIDACARGSDTSGAVEIFSRMRKEGTLGFDCFALTSVLKTCSERWDLGLGTQLHACAVKGGLESETAVGNSLVTMYSRCDEGMESCSSVFLDIIEPNVISWTSMIGGLVQSGMSEKAATLYKKMISKGEVENEFLFASVLPAFGSLASLELGRMVHCRIIKSEFFYDVGVGNALISMYFKCGSLEDARLVFDAMTTRDLVSSTVMIMGLGQHGKVKEALEFFQEIGVNGYKPDDITFLSVLSACSHGGILEDGIKIFRSMVDMYKLKPRREHFACVVDMLGRAGRLKEAEKFIEEMGMESDTFVWEALLGACSMHGEIELGERSAKRLIELEPEKDGPYVQLSNIYAGRKMWEEKSKLRKRLDVSGLKKETAQSWI